MRPRAYNDPEYVRAKAYIATHPQPCRLNRPGCTGTATTLDHQPRLTDHDHHRGAGCCRLVPACLHCNASDGGQVAQRLRASGYSWP